MTHISYTEPVCQQYQIWMGYAKFNKVFAILPRQFNCWRLCASEQKFAVRLVLEQGRGTSARALTACYDLVEFL